MGILAYNEHSPYANALALGGVDGYRWMPPKDRDRCNAYTKYDQMYWNDSTQYMVRFLEDEFPIFVPNPRTVVDTTAYYYLKGLSIAPKLGKPSPMATALTQFLDREMFYSRFHTAKHTGVARGDYVLHMTADPSKPAGKRLSLTPVHPCKVILDTDPDDCTRVMRAHLVELVDNPQKPGEKAVKELLYWYSTEDGEDGDASAPIESFSPGYDDEGEGKRQVLRTERIWSLEADWWDEEERVLISTTLAKEMLPDPIDTIPVYWFSNLPWDDGPYGFSDLRGFERISQGISQVTSDQSTALSLEGLGVYATDGGPPVDEQGNKTHWKIGPGEVMELGTAGSYFRRVEGVGSVKPNMDHVNYLESKIREASGLSDVALGRVDVQTASSGIAMAIKFMPTLAKLEERDKSGIDRLTQVFYDWKNWSAAYENTSFTDDIEVSIGDKLPTDRTGRINELNNMFDRDIIPATYYRSEMQKLGYEFPPDIQDQLDAEQEKKATYAAEGAPFGLQDNAIAAVTGAMPPPPNPNQPGQVTQPKNGGVNNSNNKKKPNESGGTEANQPVGKQARGARPPAKVTAS